LYVACIYVSAGETEAVNAYFIQFVASKTFKLLALLETKIAGLFIHSFVENRIKNTLGKNYACSVYIHPGKLLFNKVKN
jgi:hypothetical protein